MYVNVYRYTHAHISYIYAPDNILIAYLACSGSLMVEF